MRLLGQGCGGLAVCQPVTVCMCVFVCNDAEGRAGRWAPVCWVKARVTFVCPERLCVCQCMWECVWQHTLNIQCALLLILCIAWVYKFLEKRRMQGCSNLRRSAACLFRFTIVCVHSSCALQNNDDQNHNRSTPFWHNLICSAQPGPAWHSGSLPAHIPPPACSHYCVSAAAARMTTSNNLLFYQTWFLSQQQISPTGKALTCKLPDNEVTSKHVFTSPFASVVSLWE